MISGHSTIWEIDDTRFLNIWLNVLSDIVAIEKMISGSNLFERGVDEILKCKLNPSKGKKIIRSIKKFTMLD